MRALAALASIAALAVAPVHAQPEDAIDYDGFAALVAEVDAYREARRVGLDEFLSLAEQPDAIILDARSQEAFAQGHLEGAVNLPFSDFTQEKLDKLLGERERLILIYCNNNFSDDLEPVLKKRAELALNIPTFVNLYGYGYRNIYELADVISTDDPRIKFVASR